ncbi:DUF3566 domain-containing protein [Corynebacterium urealyticum]|uniref:DUF3566 domain-containing protein n=1 Tax=Corynebacterium urealyticum TaxID=43771 RepID=UPI0002B3F851|nr:DUF3566 domain-containing protein [Corynebacterium urealyticum]AGE35615.1 hypothetical protein CU7111_0011 [Corynebacterium urealyticum DSM 7111]QQB07494.1 DUF3566 domain-containing protein [Corynebacterium urealyticum]QQE51111.1 DUF3566 domain-containing protein [Corynebacterium urealyticum]
MTPEGTEKVTSEASDQAADAVEKDSAPAKDTAGAEKTAAETSVTGKVTPENATFWKARAPRGRELTLTFIDVRSAGRLGLAAGCVTFVVWVLAWMLLWLVLAVAGVWGRMNTLLADIAGFGGISGWGVLGAVALVGVLEFFVVWGIVPLTALVYNAAADVLGGLKLRVADPEDAATEMPDNVAAPETSTTSEEA